MELEMVREGHKGGPQCVVGGIAIGSGLICPSGRWSFGGTKSGVGWLFFFEFSRVGGASRVAGDGERKVSIKYQVFTVDRYVWSIQCSLLSKLAPARVGFQEKSGFLDLGQQRFSTDQTQTRAAQGEGTVKTGPDWGGRQGREPSSGQETRAFSPEGQVRAGHSAVVHGGNVNFTLQVQLSAPTEDSVEGRSQSFSGRGCRAVGKSCAPQRSHGEPCLLLRWEPKGTIKSLSLTIEHVLQCKVRGST